MIQSLLLYLPFLLLAIPCFATTIFVYKTPTTIYIGADSRRVLYMHNTQTNKIEEEIDDTYCKIRTHGKFTFAVAGFDDEGMHNLARNASAKSMNPADVVAEFATTTQRHLQSQVEKFKRDFPDKYAERFKHQSVIGEVILCFFDEKEPEILEMKFVLNLLQNGSLQIDFKPRQNILFTFIGNGDAIASQNPQDIKNRLEKTPITTILQLIKAQSQATPKGVGGPIDILTLTATNRKWMGKKANCI